MHFCLKLLFFHVSRGETRASAHVSLWAGQALLVDRRASPFRRALVNTSYSVSGRLPSVALRKPGAGEGTGRLHRLGTDHHISLEVLAQAAGQVLRSRYRSRLALYDLAGP